MKLSKQEQEFLLNLKRENKYTGREDILGEILYGAFTGIVAMGSLLNPTMFDVYKQIEKIKTVRKRKIQRALKRIINQKLIIQKGKKYYLTSKGIIILNKYRIRQIKTKIPKKWDGYFRIIMFDIPEIKKYARVALNKKLRELGFLTLQKSVFIYPHDCQQEFLEIGKFFEVEDDIVFIKTKVLSGYQKFITEFKKTGLIPKEQKFK